MDLDFTGHGNGPLSFLIVAFLGLVFGSFATALAYRVPRGISWISDDERYAARSACPSCGRGLGALDLVPILSWLCLKGRCKGCQARISPIYPLIELATVLGCLGIWFFWGLSTLNALLMMMAMPFLVALAAIDLRHVILPDQLVGILAALGVLRAGWLGFLLQDPLVTAAYVASGLAYILLAWALRGFMGFVLRREAMGWGDVKFFGAAGVWLGLQGLSPFLLFSGTFGVLLGILWRWAGKGTVFPFGPALILSFYGVLIMMAAL